MFTYLSNSWLCLYIQKCSKLELVKCLAPAPNPAYHLAWKHNFLALSLLFCLCQSLGFQRLHWKLPHSPYGSQSKIFTIGVYAEGFYESWSEPLGQWLISEWEHKLLLVNRLWWRCYIALERQTGVRQSVHSCYSWLLWMKDNPPGMVEGMHTRQTWERNRTHGMYAYVMKMDLLDCFIWWS